jgi:hypothetical protein
VGYEEVTKEIKEEMRGDKKGHTNKSLKQILEIYSGKP